MGIISIILYVIEWLKNAYLFNTSVSWWTFFIYTIAITFIVRFIVRLFNEW